MVEKITTVTSLTVSVSVGLWGFTFNEWVALGGFVLAIITLLINWYYKRLHYKLAQDEKKKEKK